MDDMGVRVKYLHSDIDTLERLEIIRDLRMGKFDVLIGINLLREGLDLPEVALIAILDADKQGFLRSETSLIQTIGRAARNVEGRVIMYADTITNAMESAISETNRRRKVQEEYNKVNNITPQSIHKAVFNVIEATKTAESEEKYRKDRRIGAEILDKNSIAEMIESLVKDMKKAARELEFEQAAAIRDQIEELKRIQNE
jgi:excinuclease ABC subunit B